MQLAWTGHGGPLDTWQFPLAGHWGQVPLNENAPPLVSLTRWQHVGCDSPAQPQKNAPLPLQSVPDRGSHRLSSPQSCVPHIRTPPLVP